ncbi:MAG: hypothetical protein L6V81_02315 [Clostridium sp.]|nr:MAG: hypothetical protein L6V81_02315 [Clostridium sp.]
MIYEYDIKDKDAEYKAYYIDNNGNVEYRNNRDVMLDIKYVKRYFLIINIKITILILSL